MTDTPTRDTPRQSRHRTILLAWHTYLTDVTNARNAMPGWAEDITAADIAACRQWLTKCERHLVDLERELTEARAEETAAQR